MPGVDDLVLRAMAERETVIDRRAVFAFTHDEAQHVPVGIVDAGRERPAAGHFPATVDLGPRAAWKGERRRDQGVGRDVPDLVLDARIAVAQHPVMAGQVAEVPGGRGADLGELGADIDEDADIELRAADAARLRDPEQPHLVQVLLGLVGQSPQLLAGLGALGQPRLQRARPRQHFLVTNVCERHWGLGQNGRRSPFDRP